MTTIYDQLSNSTKPFIIAEIGSNHMASMETTKQLIDAAKEAGCNAVKFQSWKWDALESNQAFENKKDYTAPGFVEVGLEAIKKKLALSTKQHQELKQYCEEKGIIFSSSVFDKEGVDLLMGIGVPFLKIASTDIVNYDLLKYSASKQIPLIISTGMANLEEIEQAVKVVREAGNDEIVLMHCVGLYPTPEANINLANITLLQEKFNLPVGFSDHSLFVEIPIASVALGATIIEKHFMLENQECREKKVSITPSQMKQLVEGSTQVGIALGKKERILSEAELKARDKMRRSLVIAKDLPAEHIITAEDLQFKRPGTGIPLHEKNKIIGRKLRIAKTSGDVLLLEDLI